MLFSTPNNRRFYDPDQFFSATKKRYALEEYPTRARNTPGYNPLYDTFQPITPPHFNPQFRDRRTNVYDRPCAHYFDNENHISYNRNTGK